MTISLKELIQPDKLRIKQNQIYNTDTFCLQPFVQRESIPRLISKWRHSDIPYEGNTEIRTIKKILYLCVFHLIQ